MNGKPTPQRGGENDERLFNSIADLWRNGEWHAYLRALLPLTKPTSRRLGDLVISLEEQRVTLRGQELALTPIEFRLLAWLASNPGRVFPYRALVKLVQGYDCTSKEAREIIKVHIMNLRHKLGDDPQAPRYIFCVRGVGYRFARPTEINNISARTE